MSSRPLTLRVVLAAAAIACLLTADGRGAAQRFYPDDPIWVDLDKAFAFYAYANPRDAPAKHSEGFDFLENTFGTPGDRANIRALNVNTLDEVPDSSWFTNRIGRRQMSVDEIVRGPDTIAPFDATDWVIMAGKGPGGYQPGFRAVDARDKSKQPQWFQLEGDTRDFAELGTGAEMIGTFLYHAIGYNVVDTYIVNVDPKRITILQPATIRDASGKTTIRLGATIRDASGRRPFTQGDLDGILRLLARNPDGTYRMSVSRFVSAPADTLESFRYYGTRPDDPNDIYPHEHRRELRANRVFCAWLNHDDSRAINTLDTLVAENDRKWIRHYMFDFGSMLGSSPGSRWSGAEYMYEGHPTLMGLLTFGFWIQPWQLIDYPRNLPAAVGRIEGDVFDPEQWKPEYPNPAFANMRPDDAFWGARIVAQFSDEAIAAVVRKAQYSDPRTTDYLTSVLIKRRDKIAKVWLNVVNPVVDFALAADGTLTFENAAIKARVATSGKGYTLSWSRFDNIADSHQQVGPEENMSEPQGRLPRELAGSEYVAVTVRGHHPEHPAWAQPVRAYFRRDGTGWKTVGLERTSEK